MNIRHKTHLSYCTNIHPGETWEDIFQNLKKYTSSVHKQFGLENKFGIGLRLSNQAANELSKNKNLSEFKEWLNENNRYVFTLNGFPYGGFHHEKIKDKVHIPDWSSRERFDYTVNLFNILSELLPENIDGGISTSPLSYKYWHKSEKELNQKKEKACFYLAEIVCHLVRIKERTGQSMHLDIEPEPDGVIETSDEFIAFYRDFLLGHGVKKIVQNLSCSMTQAEAAMFEHIQLCYDVCHFAVGYEDPETVIKKMNAAGIKIGKIQISAALKTSWSDLKQAKDAKENLMSFDEDTYLHQAVMKKKDGSLHRYKDLGPALENIDNEAFNELRTHFHVPIFTQKYQRLQSTQEDIIKTLDLWNKDPFTRQLEVETYTWEILPKTLKLDLVDSICREMNWVKENIE